MAEEGRGLNIRDLRNMAGITQEELASLAGITSVYISQIENGNRPLTMEAAEKIAEAFSNIASTDNIKVVFRPQVLRADHIASFYPEHIQDRINKLLIDLEMIEAELDYITHYGDLPGDGLIFTREEVLKEEYGVGSNIGEKYLKLFKQRREDTGESVLKEKQTVQIKAHKVPAFKSGRHKRVSNK